MKVLYFAEIKEILQTDSETIDINESINVDAFKQNLFERHPSIKSKKFQVAVNEEFVQDEDIIQPTDTVALIPPVSGDESNYFSRWSFRTFGKAKAFAEIDGQLFYQRIVQTLQETNMFNDIIISTNDQLANQFKHDNVIIDDANNKDKGHLPVFIL